MACCLLIASLFGVVFALAKPWFKHSGVHWRVGQDQTLSTSFLWRDRLNSMVHACAGLKQVVINEHNMRVHLIATISVIVLAIYLGISRYEWALLLIVVGWVLVMEVINTSFEYLCNVVSPEYNILVKHAKDVAAGAVLVSSIVALTIGLFVFWPYIFLKFNTLYDIIFL